MNKLLTLFMALALLVPTMSAETFELNSNATASSPSGGLSGYGANIMPLWPANGSNASQILLLNEDLAALAPQITATTKTSAKITSLTFKYNANSSFMGSCDGQLNFTVYADNVDATEFEKVNGQYQYMAFTKANKANGIFDASYDDEVWQSAFNYGFTEEDVFLTVSFDEPIVYTGQSLLLTFFAESTISSDGTYEWMAEGYSKSTSRVSALSAVGVSETEGLSGTAGGNNNLLPYISFTFDKVEEPMGPQATEEPAEPTVVGEGNLDEGLSSGSNLPFNLEVKNSIVQSLYTKAELSAFYNASEGMHAKITDITAYACPQIETMVGSGDLTVDVYVFNTDATSFPVVNNSTSWFEYETAESVVHGKATFNSESGDGWEEIFYFWGETLPVKITLDTPLEYTGNSLVITWVSNSTFEDPFGSDLNKGNSFIFNPGDGLTHSGVIAKDSPVSATGQLQGETSNLPALTIDWIKVTESVSGTPVLFSTPVLAFEELTGADGKSYNAVSASFTLTEGFGPYVIKAGTTTIGTTESNEVTLHALPVNLDKNNNVTKDVMLSVEPQGDGGIGTNCIIAAADIQALFPTATATVTEIDPIATGSYEPQYARTIELKGAAQGKITFDKPVKAANVSLTGSGVTLLHEDASGYVDGHGVLFPENASTYDAARNLVLNSGIFAFVRNNAIITLDVEHYRPVLKESASFSLTPTVELPVAYTTSGSLEVPAKFSTTTYTTKANQFKVNFDFTANAPQINIEYPGVEKIYVHEDLTTHLSVLKGGESTTLQFALVNSASSVEKAPSVQAQNDNEEAPADLDWQTAEDGILVLPLNENAGKDVFVRLLDSKNQVKETKSWSISQSGDLSGIESVEIDGVAAVEYFNLQGVRVENPQGGLFIRRQGNKAAKVYVK